MSYRYSRLIYVYNSRNEFYYNCNKQNLLVNVGGKPCGGEVAERKEQLEILLKETFQLQEGFEISVENVLSCLGFEPDKKSFLHIIPGVYTRRENKAGCKQYPFSHFT